MGQLLSDPVVTKDTSYCQNSSFRVGSSGMQGWRKSMDDAHTHILSLPDDPEAAFFAVYDGHYGDKVSKYAAEHLHKYITKQPLYKEGKIVESLKQAFLEIDDAILNDESLNPKRVGTTAVVVVVKDKLYCANAGDSRAVVSVRGRAEPLSYDHKPSNKMEHDRIKAAGGSVERDRVNGGLNMSRALGDFRHKSKKDKSREEQFIIADPDVEVKDITPDVEFIVLACDGIWNVMSNQQVVDYVREKLATGIVPEKICETLFMDCLAPPDRKHREGTDNMTAVIVCLLQGGTFDDFSTKCAAPPAKQSKDSKEQNAEDDNAKDAL